MVSRIYRKICFHHQLIKRIIDVGSLMLIDDPRELLLEVFLVSFCRRFLLHYQANIVIQLFQAELGVDNLLLLRLEVPLKICKLVIERHQDSSLRFQLGFGNFVLALCPGKSDLI